jgi:PKD domain
MRRIALVVVSLLLVAAPGAAAKTTKDFTYQSKGEAVIPGASYEDVPFTIKPDERNGSFAVLLQWADPAEDWDLEVYHKVGSDLEQVGSSGNGAPNNEERAEVQAQSGPLEPGTYIIRAVNFAAVNPSFHGAVKFEPFIPLNRRPRARLKAPKRTRVGKRVTLDASRSKDPDGKIVSYAFDLNGNGAMGRPNGKHPRLRYRFQRAGIHHISVRVVDNKGLASYANATVRVRPRRPHHRR